VWLNPLDASSSTVSFLGWRGEVTEFPHDIYSFYLSSIREEDQKYNRLLYRWIEPLQLEWESFYTKIGNLPLLYSPDDCEEEFLEYLKTNVGIDEDLNYIWGVLDEGEKRKLIKYFIRFIKFRCTNLGFEEMISAMTGTPVIIEDYFDYRYIISSTGTDLENWFETAQGREGNKYDPWMISEPDLPRVRPDTVTVETIGSDEQYKFVVDSYIDEFPEKYPPTRLKIWMVKNYYYSWGNVYHDGSNYIVRLPLNFLFNQDESYSTDQYDFFVEIESDQYIFDLKVVDDGSVNRDMIEALCKFSRPSLEGIYIRYYSYIDDLENDDNWDLVSGTATHSEDDKTLTLADASSVTVVQCNYTESSNWTDYCVAVQASVSTTSKYFEIRFMVQDSDNYMRFRVTSNGPGKAITGTWYLHRVVSGTVTLVTFGLLTQFDLDINYFWRIVAFESTSPTKKLIYYLYQDENELSSGYIAMPWTAAQGTVELVVEDGNSVTVNQVYVHPHPMESVFVGPSLQGE
jgi:hypothetical protein